MRFHYLLYFEAEESAFHNIFLPEEPLNSYLTKSFLSSSLYRLKNKKIFDKLKEELVDIIQIIDFYKIELNLDLNNSSGFNFFILHFISAIELYDHIGDQYLPIKNEVDKILNKIKSKLYKIQEIMHTSRFLVNTYIPPNLRNEIMDFIEEVIQNSEKSESLIFLYSWQKYPFIIEFQHNFSCNFDERFTKLIKKYITDELSIDHFNWDVHFRDYSNLGILICPDKKIDFKKVSDLISERLVQNIYGIYTRISDYLRYYQQNLMNLDEILPKLNYSEFLSNLKSLKFNTFGEFSLLYLQEIDSILLKTFRDSVERLDPPISKIFDNSVFGYNIYDKIKGAYISLKDELNRTITILQMILYQNHIDKILIEKKPKEKIKQFEYEKPDTSVSREYKIPDIIIQGIEKSIEISKSCENEEEKISPKVGAVLIKDNKIVEAAYRGEIEKGDHAEYTLLEKKLKSKDINNATLITTLEPCTRRSSNKISCAERIVQAGIRKVWIGINDPNPSISTKGYTYLIMNNVSVNYFPSEYAQKILKLNKEFWDGETKKYKRDVMLIPDYTKEDNIIMGSERLEKIEENLRLHKKDENKKEKKRKTLNSFKKQFTTYKRELFENIEIEVIKECFDPFLNNLSNEMQVLIINNRIALPDHVFEGRELLNGLSKLEEKKLASGKFLLPKAYLYYEAIIEGPYKYSEYICFFLGYISRNSQNIIKKSLFYNYSFMEHFKGIGLNEKEIIFVLSLLGDLNFIDLIWSSNPNPHKNDLLYEDLQINKITTKGLTFLQTKCIIKNYNDLIRFIKQIRDYYLDEDYVGVHLKILAYKLEQHNNWVINYLRIDFVHEKQENFPIESYSTDNKAIFYQEIIDIDSLFSNFTENGCAYESKNHRFFFDEKLSVPFNLKDVKKKFNTNNYQYRYIKCEKEINLIFMSDLYSPTLNSYFQKIIGKYYIYNGKRLSGLEILKRYIGFSFPMDNAPNPLVIVNLPIRSFYLKVKKSSEQNLKVEWFINGKIKDLIYLTYKLDEGGEIKIDNNTQIISIEKNFLGNIRLRLYWAGLDDLLPNECILYEKDVSYKLLFL